jgi:hypothetical protein
MSFLSNKKLSKWAWDAHPYTALSILSVGMLVALWAIANAWRWAAGKDLIWV